MNKLQKILNAFPDSDFKLFDKQVSDLKTQLKEKIQTKTLSEVNSKLEKFQSKIDFNPLVETINRIEQGFNSRSEELSSQLETKTEELQSLLSDTESNSAQKISSLTSELGLLNEQISNLEGSKKTEVGNLKKSIEEIKQTETSVNEMMDMFVRDLAATQQNITDNREEDQQALTTISSLIETVRKELLNRINNIGGGSMNRQIFIGGANPLTRYTDINLKAGSNVTITYANNDVTKKVDITISATGGGGGGGIVRSVNTVAISTAAGSNTGTDYVYLASGTITITLPTSVGNSNLYTIKNIGAGTVTVATTGGETIDGGVNAVMPVQFTSIDLISNNSGNWDIT